MTELELKNWIVSHKRWLAITSLAALLAVTGTIVASVWPDRIVKNVFPVELVKATTSTPEPPPLIPDGVRKWADVEMWIKRSDAGKGGNKVPPGYGDFLEERTGWSREDIHNFVEMEKKVNLTIKLRKGQVIENTGYNWNTHRFGVYTNFRLKKDRVVLIEPYNYVPVKQRRVGMRMLLPEVAMADGYDYQNGASTNCGNAVRFRLGQGVVTPKPVKKPVTPKGPKPGPKVCPQKAPINKYPHTTPHHTGNPSTQPPKANTGKACPTPGVVPGQPEEVAKQQEEDRDADGPTEYGQPGQDSGNVTNPDGTNEEAPPPTCPPDTTSDDQHSGDPGAPN